jgi:hypothetical protein
LTLLFDGGPKLVVAVIDGRVEDGGSERQFGWARFSPLLRHANGAAVWRCHAAVRRLTVFDHALRVSAAIADQRAAGG